MTIFPKWPTDVRDLKDDQTYIDHEVIPDEMRTKEDRKNLEDGGFHEIDPITILRRAYIGVYVEIVRIDYWIGRREDGMEFYQVNLVSPTNLGFAKDQRGTVSFAYNLGGAFCEFEAVTGLLADARRFIEWYKDERQKKFGIECRAPEHQEP